MMRGSVRIAIALTVILSACAFPCLAQKITVDPNVGPAVERADVPDPRLAQKISYECWHKPVKLILAELTKQTGVTLNAGYNKQDWQVRDRRMNIYVKDVTLAGLMNSIARVMKFKWSKSRDLTPPTYRLIANRKLIADLQAKASRLQAALKQEAARRRTKLLDTFENLADASPAEIEKLKSENPYLYVCAETGFAKLVNRMFSEIPELKDALTSAGKNVCPPMRLLSAETQKLCGEVIAKQWRYRMTENRLPRDYEARMAEGSVRLICVPWPSSPSQLNYFASISCGGDLLHTGCFENPDCKANQVGAKMAISYADLGRTDYLRVAPDLDQEFRSAEKERSQEQDSYTVADPITQHPDEPDLHRKLDLRKRWNELEAEEVAARGTVSRDMLRLRRELKAIALAPGLGIVSDSFAEASFRGSFDPMSTDKELIDVLDSFGAWHFSNWEKHGSTLEFRCRDWFSRRASQIPDEWVQRWREILERTGALPLDEYAQMATLDYPQIRENLMTDPVLAKVASPGPDYADNQGVLRFYLRLNHDQKQKLFADGLDVRWLSPDQWQCYSEMFGGYRCTWDTARFSDPGDKRVTIKAGIAEDTDKRRKWFFTVYVEDENGGTIDTTFRVPIPNVPVKPATPAKPE